MQKIIFVVLFTFALFLVQAPWPTGASAAQATEPQVWQWKTWVIRSPDQYRVATPPDGAGTAAEIKQLKDLAAQRTPAALDAIAYWNIVGPSYRGSEIAVSDALQRGLHSNIAYCY